MLRPTPTAVKEGTTVIWTAVASSGAVDENSLGNYAFDLASFGYNSISGAQDPIVAYYNVVNTYRADPGANPNQPPWHNLEVGAVAPGNSSVVATIFRVDNCTGNVRDLCRVGFDKVD